jgi:hypothetical protein
LKFLSCYENEDAFLPLISISNNLQHASLVMGGTTKAKRQPTLPANNLQV